MIEILSPITANVWRVLVSVGQKVNEGDTLIILEAMKMEISVDASDSGTVAEILVIEGGKITEKAPLIRLS